MSQLECLIIPRTRDLGDGFEVRRALPSVERRMVGPFVFLDQMGPAVLGPGTGLDVRPHPHIGLATVTWLLEGEIVHRDSLGNLQPIRAGEVNWMTAGRGIVHSERSGPIEREAGSRLSGLQCWVALPRSQEECVPDFTHLKAADLPVTEGEGVNAVLVAGEFMGMRASLPTRSPLYYVQLTMQPGARLAVPADYDEQAMYVVSGDIDLGADGRHSAGHLLVTKLGAVIEMRAGAQGAIVMLLGGEPLDGPRHLAWNFVSSSEDRIRQASQQWLDQQFPSVPDETEFIPLPESLRPADYP